MYILLAIAPSSDWCRIPIESGYHSLDGPYQTNTIYTRNTVRSPQLRGIAPTALLSHSGTAGQQPREPVGATRNKPAVGPAYNGSGTGMLRRVQDRTSSSFASIHPR